MARDSSYRPEDAFALPAEADELKMEPRTYDFKTSTELPTTSGVLSSWLKEMPARFVEASEQPTTPTTTTKPRYKDGYLCGEFCAVVAIAVFSPLALIAPKFYSKLLGIFSPPLREKS